MNSKGQKLVYASAVAASLTIVFVTVITIWAEFSVPLKGYLKSLSGHHWVTKSYGSLIVYFLGLMIFYAFAQNLNEKSAGRAIVWAIWSAILGSIALTGFFILHFMKFF
ncbi:hypothetical protein HYW53_02930 [Candidatus Giovannonibacteria bacterium]|nr:hypothetical protein [Candidatus Giovannonibacteria bacterium]